MNRDLGRLLLRAFALLASIGAAGGAVYAVFTVVGAYQERLRAVEDEYRVRVVDVPMPVHLVGIGSVLVPADFAMVSIGADYVPDGALTRLDQLVGRTVEERLLPGEPVRVERLAAAEAGQGLSAIIPNGMRAISLNLADGEKVSGFIDPSDYVDLLVTLPADDATGRMSETRTLAQGVRVLAVDERISETVRKEKIVRQQVTLAIGPDVVERVTHALEVGRAKLTLRSPIDFTNVETNGARVATLLGTDQKRLSVTEFRERFTDDDVVRMIDMVAGKDKVRERVIDPALLRGADFR